VLLAALCLGKEPEEIAASVTGSAALKSLVTVAINDFFAPIRARRAAFARDPGYLRQVLGEGNDRANQIADATLAEVRTAMGMDYTGSMNRTVTAPSR
jgi:tryptophanyl-tRNA synthetase